MRRKIAWLTAVMLGLLVVVVAGCSKQEATTTRNLVSQGAIKPDIKDGEPDAAVWGKYYPKEYDSYLKNQETSDEGTKYGGSIQSSHLKKYPDLLILFAGYGFSKEYNEDRGHVYTLTDVTKIKRVNEKTTGSCMTCKSSQVPTLIKEMGIAYYKTPFSEIKNKVQHPIGCANCHDAKTMNLKITQPPLLNALKRLGKDPDNLTRQELRTYVCQQCHVEYYFKPDTKEVIFPWDKGFTPDEIEAYYDELGFKDWDHPQAGTALLKAQHPESETFINSTHQAAGLACADCHMPYTRVGNEKITSHWWTSPLKTMQQSCGTCHREDTDWLKKRVLYTQDKTAEMLANASEANIEAIQAIEAAAKTPKADAKLLEEARKLHRKSQWRWDFVAAENSMGFHNPQLALKTLGEAADLARQAQLKAVQAQVK